MGSDAYNNAVHNLSTAVYNRTCKMIKTTRMSEAALHSIPATDVSRILPRREWLGSSCLQFPLAHCLHPEVARPAQKKKLLCDVVKSSEDSPSSIALGHSTFLLSKAHYLKSNEGPYVPKRAQLAFYVVGKQAI